MRRPRKFDERAVFLSDLHVPHHDERAYATALEFIRYFKPTHIFLMGDFVDFYSLSRFDKNPERKLDLQDDADETFYQLSKVREAAPTARIYYIQGNHELRLTKFLWRVPEFVHIRALNVENLLRLDQLKIKYIPSGSMQYHGFIVKHGHLSRKRSGYSATGELEAAGVSGASGHSHRLGQVYKRNVAGVYTWIETGCLCDLNPEYGEGQTMDWMQGFGYGMFRAHDDRFVVHTLPIVKGSVVFGEREICATGLKRKKPARMK